MISSTTMTLADVRDLLECEVLVDNGALEKTTITVAGAADMMSDVLAFIHPGALLLTGLTNAQSIRTALIADVVAVVYVRNKTPVAEAVALAKDAKLPVMVTALAMYESCGRLYAAGLPGITLGPPRKGAGSELHPGI